MSDDLSHTQARSSGVARPVVVVVGAVVVILVVGAVMLVNAPANWLARFLAARTQGRVLLADARGTIWSGNAVLAIGSRGSDAADADGESTRESTREATPDRGRDAADAAVAQSDRLALPGRVIWTLEIVRTLAPVLHLTHDGVLLQPVDVRYANGDLDIGAGAAVLPTSMLQLAGPPLNTLRPEGRSELRWKAMRIDAGGALVGEGTVRIVDLSLAVSPVKPLGDYRVTWSNNASGLIWTIATEHGPLELQGSGSRVDSPRGPRAQMRVTARAAADASSAVAAQLKTLLDTIGTRGGNEAVIETGNKT